MLDLSLNSVYPKNSKIRSMKSTINVRIPAAVTLMNGILVGINDSCNLIIDLFYFFEGLCFLFFFRLKYRHEKG